MEKFIFTFGGINPLFINKYVVIQAEDYGKARKIMFDLVGDKWCFQYTEEQWKKLTVSEDYRKFSFFCPETEISIEEIKEKLQKECQV